MQLNSRRILAVLPVVVALALAFPTAASAPADVNLSAFANGALIESVTSEYSGGWEARLITDESADTGWCNVQAAKPPFAIVLSLPERSEIRSLEFDTASVENAARGVKDIDVAVSDTSATAGFTPLGSVSLKQLANKQVFPLAKPGTGRWIKLTIKTNHGDPEYYELMEFRAMGTMLSTTPMPANLSGTYHSDLWGNFHLQQDGPVLTGCYEHAGGVVQGGAESHLMRLTWRQDGGSVGPAVMVLHRDGKNFEGWWMREGGTRWSTDWALKKISDTVGSCPHWNPKGASGNLVAAGLAAEGRVRLYGINFDVDSDHLRADAKSAIDQLIAALKANPAWNVSIEGHTDSTGAAARNLELSRLRATAVKAALVTGGIVADRMTTTGLGQTKPLASNDTEVGRAQNRRVEVVKK